MTLGVITIHLAPEFHLGPVTLAWHGLTIAIGLIVAGFVARSWARHQQLDPEPLISIATAIMVGGVLGARAFYLLEHDPSALLNPASFLKSHGFTFDGGMILGGVFAAAYVQWQRLAWSYLDAVAYAVPIGVAVGRIGDIINGEHYGAPSQFFLAVRNAHPDALTPNPAIAYQNGGVYEVLLALVIFAIIWPIRFRFSKPLQLGWLVIALFAIGRFLEFFLRADSPALALGLSNAQWTSAALLGVALGGLALTVRGPLAR